MLVNRLFDKALHYPVEELHPNAPEALDVLEEDDLCFLLPLLNPILNPLQFLVGQNQYLALGKSQS